MHEGNTGDGLVDCPNFGSDNTSPVKAWTRGSGDRAMHIEHYVCACGQSFISWVEPKTGKLKVMPGKGPKA
jgi:hypothetical protein